MLIVYDKSHVTSQNLVYLYCDIGIIFYHIWCDKHRNAILLFSFTRKVGCHA